MEGNREVIPLDPPSESKPGDRIYIEGFNHCDHGGKLKTCVCVLLISHNYLFLYLVQ